MEYGTGMGGHKGQQQQQFCGDYETAVTTTDNNECWMPTGWVHQSMGEMKASS